MTLLHLAKISQELLLEKFVENIEIFCTLQLKLLKLIHFTDILNEWRDIIGYLKMRAKLNKRCPSQGKKVKEKRLKEKTGWPYDKMLIDCQLGGTGRCA